MKLMDAINEVDNLKPNMYGLPEKIEWINRLEKRIWDEVFSTHELNEGEEEREYREYTEDDRDTELLVGKPFDELYAHWLSTQIDWNNREYVGFNNSNAMFESVYAKFSSAYNRTHMPKGGRKIYY